jgi:predicted dehydrogenase
VLGKFSQQSSILNTHYKTINVVNGKGEIVYPNHLKTSPDHIMVQGTLTSGALVSLTFRTVTGKPVNETGISWIITGTDGEIEVRTPNLQWQMDPPGTSFKMRNNQSEEVQTIYFSLENEDIAVKNAPFPGTNTARQYEAFATENWGTVPNFTDALETHRLLESIKKVAK